jgi:hypothetical protein
MTFYLMLSICFPILYVSLFIRDMRRAKMVESTWNDFCVRTCATLENGDETWWRWIVMPDGVVLDCLALQNYKEYFEEKYEAGIRWSSWDDFISELGGYDYEEDFHCAYPNLEAWRKVWQYR